MAGQKSKQQKNSSKKSTSKKPTQTSHQPKKSVVNEALTKSDNRLAKFQSGQKLALIFLRRSNMLEMRRPAIVELMTTLGCDVRMIPYNGKFSHNLSNTIEKQNKK